MPTTVTRAQADAVAAAVARRYRAYIEPVMSEDGSRVIVAAAEGPVVMEGFMGFDGFHVVWEDGPYEWAYRFTMGGVDEEVAHALHTEGGKSRADAGRLATEAPATLPARLADRVHIEPTTSYAIGVHPA
jgi:hypothetical protein